MPSPQELDRVIAGAAIPAIDSMFDEPTKMRAEIIEAAFNLAFTRAQVLCDVPIPDDDYYRRMWNIVARSGSKIYQTPGGQSVELALCMIKAPASPVVGETRTNDVIGLLIRADEFEPGPIMQLSRWGLSVDPATTLDRTRRENQPEDLRSFFSVLNMFDGQGIFV